MPGKYHPAEAFVKRVPTWKMHIFTLIQTLALVLLWAIKSSSISLVFPFILILMVPLRQRMSALFTQPELEAVNFALFCSIVVFYFHFHYQHFFFFYPIVGNFNLFFSNVNLLSLQLDGVQPSVDPNDEPDFYEQANFPA